MAKRAGAKRLATELRDARWEVNHSYWPEFTAQQSSALRDVGYTGVTGHAAMLGLLLEQSCPTGEFVRVAVTYLD